MILRIRNDIDDESDEFYGIGGLLAPGPVRNSNVLGE